MRGYGTIKLGMLYPEVFGAIYAESLAVLDMTHDYSIYHPSMKVARQAKNTEELLKDFYATA